MQPIALILAGGASRRMGRDKLQLPWATGGAKTVLQHVTEVAASVASAVWVLLPAEATDASAEFDLSGRRELRVIRDHESYTGPLSALAVAWPRDNRAGQQAEAIDTELDKLGVVFVLAGDLPGLHAEVLESCRQRLCTAPFSDGAVVQRSGQLQPLIGCYRPRAGAVLKACAAAGETRLMRALSGLTVTAVDARAEGWPEWWTRPLHTPDDYADWLGWQASQAGHP